MKEKLTSALGSFGFVLFYIFIVLYAYAPLLVLDFPIWVDLLLILVISTFRGLGGILCLGLYIWALVVVLTHPFNVISAIFLVCTVLYFFTSVFPSIKLIFNKNDDF